MELELVSVGGVAVDIDGRVMPWMKRRNMGRAWGTTSAWQMPVARIVVKIWRIQARRSARMMEGKTEVTSTSEERDSVIRDAASSDT